MASSSPLPTPNSNTAFGHPKGLLYLFFAELWERFSFYGMRALLIIYMTKVFLFEDTAAYGVYAAYGSLVYATPLIGGMLADRIGGMLTLLIASASQAIMLVAFALVDSRDGLYLAAILFGIGFTGIMPCYALILRLLFPVNEMGWRIAAQYLFAAMGMALGGWLGGFIYDATGSYHGAWISLMLVCAPAVIAMYFLPEE